MRHVLQLDGPVDGRNARRGLTARPTSRASLALASIASLTLVAQVANSEDAQLEEIVVTGSRIPVLRNYSITPTRALADIRDASHPAPIWRAPRGAKRTPFPIARGCTIDVHG